MERMIKFMMPALFLIILSPAVLGASWSSYVLNSTGAVIDGANVSAVNSSNGAHLNSVLTDANGLFNISIPDSTSVNLTASKSGYQDDISQSLPPITSDLMLPFNITLIKFLPGNITGRITDSSGNGIGNAIIEAVQGNSTIGSASTDSNGDYTISGLLDGTYTLNIVADSITQQVVNVVVLPESIVTVDSAFAIKESIAAAKNGARTLRTRFSCLSGYELIEGRCARTEKPKEVIPETVGLEEPGAEAPSEPSSAPATTEEEMQPRGAAQEEKPLAQVPLRAGIALLAILALFAVIMLYRKYKAMNKIERKR